MGKRFESLIDRANKNKAAEKNNKPDRMDQIVKNREESPRPVSPSDGGSFTDEERLQRKPLPNDTEIFQKKTKTAEGVGHQWQDDNETGTGRSGGGSVSGEDPHQPNYFSFVIDTTSDMSLLYYPQIHKLLTSAVNRIEELQRENGFKAMIGITTFHNDPTGDKDKLGEDYFTQDFMAVRNRLDHLSFYGGDEETGRECIDQAQMTALKRMAEARYKNDRLAANCSQILITSSLPRLYDNESDESRHVADFRSIPGEDNLDPGVRFALNIVLDRTKYAPIFKMVDNVGDRCTGKGNLCKICDLSMILNGEVEDDLGNVLKVGETSDVISNILTDLLKQTSLYSG